ncbi:uncharacterized protein [Amphiura filiformis]|uniref:uncharacterized protein n=1 Tax=Amphiura filiformis TaxID=82378 RepID=UPI003B219E24
MKMNLVVMVIGIFIMFSNSVNSKKDDCIEICNECVELSDTLSHLGCTRHCEEFKENNNGHISCSRLTELDHGSPHLEDEIKQINAKKSKLIAAGDIDAIIQEIYADDCIYMIKGQAPGFGKADMELVWYDWFESNPGIDLIEYTPSAFGEHSGRVWEDGVGTAYKDDVLVGSFHHMEIYKRINGRLFLYIDIVW